MVGGGGDVLGAPSCHELGPSLGSELASPVGCYNLWDAVERYPIMRESVDDRICADILNWNGDRPTREAVDQR